MFPPSSRQGFCSLFYIKNVHQSCISLELSSICNFLFPPKFLKRISAFHFSSLILSLIHWDLSLHSASLWQFDSFSDWQSWSYFLMLWIILEMLLCSLECHFLTFSPLTPWLSTISSFSQFHLYLHAIKSWCFCVYSWSSFLLIF